MFDARRAAEHSAGQPSARDLLAADIARIGHVARLLASPRESAGAFDDGPPRPDPRSPWQPDVSTERPG